MVDNVENRNVMVDRQENVLDHKRNVHFRRMRLIKRIASHIILLIFAGFAVFPIYYVVITSFDPIGSLVNSSIQNLIPNISLMTLSNYTGILFNNPFLLWLRNTLILTASGTVVGVLLSISAGLAMSRMRVPGKKALLYMLLILSLFPLTIMVIPFYFMFSGLHLTRGTAVFVGLIIAYSAGAAIYSAYLIKNYVDALPKDYEEAAQLDGYTRSGALFRVLIPIARPVVVFASVIAFMGPYTDYALAGQMITQSKFYTLAIGMYLTSRGDIVMNYGVFSAFAVLMGLPIFILFLVFQKYLVSGFSLSMYK